MMHKYVYLFKEGNADMRNLLVDWADKTVVFEGNYQTEREVAKIIADISGKKYMLLLRLILNYVRYL